PRSLLGQLAKGAEANQRIQPKLLAAGELRADALVGNQRSIREAVGGGIDSERPHHGDPGWNANRLEGGLERPQPTAAILGERRGSGLGKAGILPGQALHHRAVQRPDSILALLALSRCLGELLHLEVLLGTLEERIPVALDQAVIARGAGSNRDE